MKTRESLQAKLEELLGSRNVYFQPPSSVRLRYPCVVYKLSDIEAFRADNKAYKMTDRYEITYIDKSPDAKFHKQLMEEFELCSFDRSFQSDNLNHYVLSLFY